MPGVWCWLGSNSSQLQAIGSIGAVLVAAALAIVAVRQARAADAQANAARAQALAADRQVEAANRQVEAANRQIETSILIADKQYSPNISITAAARNGIIQRDTMAILNNGSGSAQNIKLHYRDQGVDNELPLNDKVLVVRDSLEVRFDGGRAATSGFRLTYSTIFGTRYALEFQWNGNASRPVNERLLVIAPVAPPVMDPMH